MSDVVFLDTETTGLLLDDDIWEFAAIRRYEDGEVEQQHFFIEHDRKKCATLPEPFRKQHYERYRDHLALTREHAAMRMRNVLIGKPHIVGAVPNFDTERIARALERENLRPDWHYHLIDVENLGIGFLAGLDNSTLPLPWDSNSLSRALGIDPERFDRHTALGDVLWAQAIYDRILGEADVIDVMVVDEPLVPPPPPEFQREGA